VTVRPNAAHSFFARVTGCRWTAGPKAAVAFLASDDSSFITASTFLVDA
jgi:hypothetical protein